MFNNRMLAVAAVLVMAVPALGAATPIVVPPVPEQLVEGHTVFTVIEIVRATDTAQVRFAAAVAVLVREVNADNRRQRFPGVLWFNDQYLVNPSSNAVANRDFRVPCGGAVMAVNAGDPDPRIAIARINAGDVTMANAPGPLGPTFTAGSGQFDFGETNETYAAGDYWVKPTPGTYYYGQDSGGPGDAPTDYAWIGVKPSSVSTDAADPSTTTVTPGEVYSDTVLGTTVGFDYVESYLITDPNDHSWIIDKYAQYTRDPAGTIVYSNLVWVVNILGSPVFTTDEGDNCAAFADLVPDSVTVGPVDADGDSVNEVPETTIPVGDAIRDATCGQANPTDTGVYEDNPCLGYEEPSGSTPAYCYGGQPGTSAADCATGREGGMGAERPFRYYNAVLYFKWEDLTDKGGAARDHTPGASTDTNGCSQEQYWWGPNPPLAADQYPCPGGDDNAEGNSHPFHPTAPNPAHRDVQPCPPGFDATANPTNHGGSTYVDPPAANADGWYSVAAPCDYLHAVADIDIYFSPGGRPFPPVVPNFVIRDLEGSSAPFNGLDGSPTGH